VNLICPCSKASSIWLLTKLVSGRTGSPESHWDCKTDKQTGLGPVSGIIPSEKLPAVLGAYKVLSSGPGNILLHEQICLNSGAGIVQVVKWLVLLTHSIWGDIARTESSEGVDKIDAKNVLLEHFALWVTSYLLRSCGNDAWFEASTVTKLNLGSSAMSNGQKMPMFWETSLRWFPKHWFLLTIWHGWWPKRILLSHLARSLSSLTC
jgi:hypothetical protein